MERYVCFTPKTELMHCNKRRTRVAMIYSITSSAIASRPGGKAKPSALAVLRLMKAGWVVDLSENGSDDRTVLRPSAPAGGPLIEGDAVELDDAK